MFVLTMLIGVGIGAVVLGTVGGTIAAKYRKREAAIARKRYEWWQDFVNSIEGPTQSQLWLELVKADAEGIVDKEEIRKRHDEIISFNKRTYQGFKEPQELSVVVQKDADNSSSSVESETSELEVAA